MKETEPKAQSTTPPGENKGDSPDVHRISVDGREIILVGTAHISRHSTELVREVIEREKPDCVCVELDERRYQSLIEPNRWKNLNLLEVIRKKQLSTLLVQLVLSSYQRRLGAQLGVQPGMELLEATQAAEEHGIPVALCDRDVGVTLKRAWRRTGFFRKSMLLSSLFASAFDRTEISEEQLQELKDQDVLTEMLQEVGEAMPAMKTVLIDERDDYLAEKIREAKGKKIVAVVGAGHVKGMVKRLEENLRPDLQQLEALPPPSHLWKVIGIAIPLLIVASLVWIGYSKGADKAIDNLVFWILVNGIPSSIGAALALAHPVTVLIAFLAAPITSLTPVIGAGYVVAFVQTWLRPPRVYELQQVGDDMGSLRKWWSNRLLRTFLAFVLSSLGSVIGTWVGAVEIFRNIPPWVLLGGGAIILTITVIVLSFTKQESA